MLRGIRARRNGCGMEGLGAWSGRKSRKHVTNNEKWKKEDKKRRESKWTEPSLSYFDAMETLVRKQTVDKQELNARGCFPQIDRWTAL